LSFPGVIRGRRPLIVDRNTQERQAWRFSPFLLPPLEGGSEREGGVSVKRFFEENHPHLSPLPRKGEGKKESGRGKKNV